MADEKQTALETTTAEELVEIQETQSVPMGFEEDDSDDMVIPRIKVIQSLSPERKDKTADEGDIINSLTLDRLNGKVFVPVFKFTNIILWKDRADGGGIEAISHDGITMIPSDGSEPYPVGTLAMFDNTKQGKDALPKATRYMNFFGFIAGERMPVILSFAKTNYNEGKKLYSLAKVSMQNMWNFGYTLNEKLMAKNGNEWYNLTIAAAGATAEADRTFGLELFKTFRGSIQNIKYDMDDNGEARASDTTPSVNVDATEY